MNGGRGFQIAGRGTGEKTCGDERKTYIQLYAAGSRLDVSRSGHEAPHQPRPDSRHNLTCAAPSFPLP